MEEHGSNGVPRSQRWLSLAALAVLSAAAAAGLGRLFEGRATSVLLVAVALVSLVVAEACRRRGLLLAAAVSALGLLVTVGLAVFPETTWYGVPTPETLGAVGRALGLVGLEARTQVAPSAPLPPLVMASVGAIWLSGFAAHALLNRAGAPILAVLPPIALFTFADVVRDEGSRPAYAVAMLIGVLGVVFVDGLRKVQRWGPFLPWRPSADRRRRSRVLGTATRGAREVGVIVVLTAALAPGLLPGWGHDSVLETRPSGGEGTAVNPFVSLRASLERGAQDRLFQVRSEQPSYWRMLALDRFDGSTWTTADLSLDEAPQLEPGTILPVDPVQPLATSDMLEQRFEIVGLRSPWLPMAWLPVSIDAGSSVRYDPIKVAAMGSGRLEEGATYSVRSTTTAPTADALDRAQPIESFSERGGLPEGWYEHYTALPLEVSPTAATLAHELAAEEPTAFRAMVAIQRFLRQEFRYDEDVEAPPGVDPVEWFLTRSRAGFCQQFAGTMAVMARTLGLPARVAVGFLPGYDAGVDRWSVTSEQAHAWPEIYFPGSGWVAFEPTPGRSNPVSRSYLTPAALDGARETTQRPRVETPRRSDLDAAPGAGELRWKTRHGGDLGVIPADDPHPRMPWGWLVVIVLLLSAVVLLAIPPLRALRRKRWLRRARGGSAAALAAWRVFEDCAEDLGLGRRPGQTLNEYQRTLDGHVRWTDGHAHRLMQRAAVAAYGSPADSQGLAPAEVSRADLGVALQELRACVSLSARVRGWFRLRVATPQGSGQGGLRSRS